MKPTNNADQKFGKSYERKSALSLFLGDNSDPPIMPSNNSFVHCCKKGSDTSDLIRIAEMKGLLYVILPVTSDHYLNNTT